MDPLDPLDLEEELAGLQASDFLDLSTWSVGLRRGHSGRGPFIEGWIQLSADITAHLFGHQNSFYAQRCPGWMHLGFQISRNLGKYAVITTAACGGYSEPTANQRMEAHPARPLPTAHCCSPLLAESQLSPSVPSQAGDEVSVL